ncbi:hypothetical protein DFH08DRAFT_826576 [Mycena albidolilacea]|uniref:Uncharacterized protein n=1 Tax=Mycena albidolilacea TaxID=1033008 RepID=A0AAD7E947_9AGAR|nr:hypothetical protein DFH08DRAFT_826576 [Mycena albidolilacea]
MIKMVIWVQPSNTTKRAVAVTLVAIAILSTLVRLRIRIRTRRFWIDDLWVIFAASYSLTMIVATWLRSDPSQSNSTMITAFWSTVPAFIFWSQPWAFRILSGLPEPALYSPSSVLSLTITGPSSAKFLGTTSPRKIWSVIGSGVAAWISEHPLRSPITAPVPNTSEMPQICSSSRAGQNGSVGRRAGAMGKFSLETPHGEGSTPSRPMINYRRNFWVFSRITSSTCPKMHLEQRDHGRGDAREFNHPRQGFESLRPMVTRYFDLFLLSCFCSTLRSGYLGKRKLVWG